MSRVLWTPVRMIGKGVLMTTRATTMRGVAWVAILGLIVSTLSVVGAAAQSAVPVQPASDIYDIHQFNPTGEYTGGLTLADFDDDGLSEIVIGNRVTSRVEIWAQDTSAAEGEDETQQRST